VFVTVFGLISLFTLIAVNVLCQRSSRQSAALASLTPQPALMIQKSPTITPPAATVKNIPHHVLSKQGFTFTTVNSIHQLSKDWEIAQPDNLFLQRVYLTAVEENPPRGMRFCYLIFYKQGLPVGVAYCQVSHFSADYSIQNNDEKEKYPCILRAFGRFLRNLIVGKNHNLLVCGNLLLTGEHGFYFKTGAMDKSTSFDLLEEAMILVQKDLESRKVNIDGIFIKDVCEEHRAPGKVLIDRKFKEFTFHPNMLMNLPAAWQSFDDYMGAISSKYRVRAKRAFKLSANLQRVELSESQVLTNKTRLYELYQKVVDNQDFNMVTLHENYLPSLKLAFGERFRIFGYYQNGELTGYYTTLQNAGELEAHFLGFEPECNKNCQLYLNILFDILRQGIETGVHRIVYARTAMEIKSSVGATAAQMYCYIRASNSITNRILPSLLEYLRPPDDWLPRNPFKDEEKA
jgi:hypothetical protein